MAEKESEKGAQKVKIVGPLWTFRSLLAIVRDILLVLFLLVALGLMIASIFILPGILNNLAAMPAMLGAMQSGGPEALVNDIQKEVEEGNWEEALAKVEAIESLMKQTGMEPEAQQMINEAKIAIRNKDKARFDKLLSQMEGEGFK